MAVCDPNMAEDANTFISRGKYREGHMSMPRVSQAQPRVLIEMLIFISPHSQLCMFEIRFK